MKKQRPDRLYAKLIRTGSDADAVHWFFSEREASNMNNADLVEQHDYVLASDAAALVARLDAVVKDFMPNIGVCVLQNYAELNDALIAARAFIERNK